MNKKKTRWQVEITQITGDRSLVESVLEAQGFELDGDRISSDQFEGLDDEKAVRLVAAHLCQTFRDIVELDDDIEADFSIGNVIEHRSDGSVSEHTVVLIQGTATLGLASFNAQLQDGSLSEAERCVRERKAKIENLNKLVRLAMSVPDLIKVKRLVEGDASYYDIYKAYEAIRKDVGKRMLLKIAPEKEWKRFTGTLNHPDVSGDDARHAHLDIAPPDDPMSKRDVYAFTKKMVEGWIEIKTGQGK